MVFLKVFACHSCSIAAFLMAIVWFGLSDHWPVCQLQIPMHMTVQSVVSGTKPHQSNLLLTEKHAQDVPVYLWSAIKIVFLVEIVTVVMLFLLSPTPV